jgi:hypothetical protein
MGGECIMYGERKCGYRVLVGKPEEKTPFGRPRHRWEDNIKWAGTNPIDLAEDKERRCSVANAAMNLLQVP